MQSIWQAPLPFWLRRITALPYFLRMISNSPVRLRAWATKSMEFEKQSEETALLPELAEGYATAG